MKKHKNIPFFIPHEGCGYRCIFCSQVKITGVCRTEKDTEAEVAELKRTVESALPTLDGAETEIAFFGGSFTGIERPRMLALLEAASRYIGGAVKGIRLSTRPDYIDTEICTILSRYGVTAVELGIQSASDEVLEANRRGHTAFVSEKACSLVRENGFLLTGQMMTGMYGSSPADELNTARKIVEWGAESTRIYPTVVFTGTPLYDLTVSGQYVPLTTETAVARTADCALVFIQNGLDILRIGLHSSENLADAPFGATHPALGELVEGEIYYRVMSPLLADEAGRDVTVFVPLGCVSKAVGQHRINAERLMKETGVRSLKFREDGTLGDYRIRTESN